jgi:hypothetical protein
MNMQFSQTSGSKPELDSGTGITLKYDGDTEWASGKLGVRMAAAETVSADMGSSRARNKVILHDLRHDRLR